MDNHNFTINIEKKLISNNIKSCEIYWKNKSVFNYTRKAAFQTEVLPINSCTKSITSALIGICLDQGYLQSIHDPFFPLLKVAPRIIKDPKMKDITIYQLITMTSGIDWDEATDWLIFNESFQDNVLNYILAKHVNAPGGTHMNYSSGDSYLLSAIIQQVTGQTTEAFAKDHLFNPLGIKDYKWPSKQGINLGSHGMFMTAKDMMTFGLLYLNKGKYKGSQILSQQWIEQSFKPSSIANRIKGHYGYQWWIMDATITPTKSITLNFAMGFGGQVIIVVPELELVTVITRNIDRKTTRSIELFKSHILGYFI